MNLKVEVLWALGLVAGMLMLMLYWDAAQARGYHVNNVTNVTNVTNNYLEENNDYAMGACALSKAADSFSPYVHSTHWQYAIGIGHCEGHDRQANAIDFGLARRILRDGGHVMMGSCSIGRSSDEITALGCGISGHFD
jgi:hypothetical protein